MTLTGYQNYTTDVITLYDGGDDTAYVLYNASSYDGVSTISVNIQSSQNYVYVKYLSTSSYGNYTLSYMATLGWCTYLIEVDVLFQI